MSLVSPSGQGRVQANERSTFPAELGGAEPPPLCRQARPQRQKTYSIVVGGSKDIVLLCQTTLSGGQGPTAQMPTRKGC